MFFILLFACLAGATTYGLDVYTDLPDWVAILVPGLIFGTLGGILASGD